jgi:outer membrane protein, heavy metal efflux system
MYRSPCNSWRPKSRRTCPAAIAFAGVIAMSLASVVNALGDTVVNGAQPDVELAKVELIQPLEVLPPIGPEVGMTLAQLEQMALAANPSVARAAALVGAARGQWVQVGLPPNPSVGYEGQQLGSGGQAEQHGILFSQEIVRGGKLELNREVAAREIAIAEQELAIREQRVLTDVRVAFYQVLLAEEQIRLAQSLIQLSLEGSSAVESLFQAQEVGRADVLQAQLEVENAQMFAENARNRRDAAWRNLTAVIGNPELSPSPLSGDVRSLPASIEFEQALTRLQSESPEVAAAALRVERARSALQRACVETVPNVNFQGLVNWQDNGIGGDPDGGVAVTIPLPLFNKNQGAIRRAQQELTAARRALDQLTLDLQNRLAPTFERYSNARNQVERYRAQILPAAEESLNLTRQTYEAGESNYIGLLTVQRTFAQTSWNYLEALRALRTAEAEIQGFLLRGSLQDTDLPSSMN